MNSINDIIGGSNLESVNLFKLYQEYWWVLVIFILVYLYYKSEE
jgi:hypothetical protein